MRCYLFFFCLVLYPLGTEAQETATLSGRVESPTHEALVGALLQIEGTSRGTTTDLDGRFTLENVPLNAEILCTYVGFEPRRITLNEGTEQIIQLEPLPEMLNEVVFTGYRYQKKSEVTGAISSVEVEEIEEIQGNSIERMLQGRAAGVAVEFANGLPGGSANILIRGATSVTGGRDPLFIIDGVQVNSTPITGGGLDITPLAFLTPEDIESIEILKDAASASIYGSQAANGVIVITTKRGQRGKTHFNFSTYQGVNTQLNDWEFMSSQELVRFRIQQFENDANFRGLPNPIGRGLLGGLANTNFPFGQYDVTTPDEAEDFLTDDIVNSFIDGLPTYDWFDAAYQNGRIQNYQLSASGGNDKTRFFTAFNFQDTEGQIISTHFNRLQFRLNLDHQATEKLNLSTKFNLSRVGQTNQFLGGFFFRNPQFSGAVLPWNPIRDEEGEFTEPLLGRTFINSIKGAELNEPKTRLNQLIGSFQVTYQFSPAWQYRGLLGVDYGAERYSFFGDPRSAEFWAENGVAFEWFSANTNLMTTQQLSFEPQWEGRHTLGAYAVWEFRHEQQELFFAEANNFPNELFQTINSASNLNQIGSQFTEWKNLGSLLNLKYDYADKYYLNASIRYDGSSRFGSQNQFGWFPSVSASWRINQEPFFTSGLISDLKLRIGWGVTGNNRIPNFAARSLISGGDAYLGEPALGVNQLGNDLLTWEEQSEWNLGLDYELWEGRVSGAIDAFSRTTSNLLLNRPLLPSSGFQTITENTGTLVTRGLEFLINIDWIRGKDFRWRTSFNLSAQQQEVTEIFGDQNNYLDILFLGEPAYVWYDFDFAGVNPSNGRPFWYDRNGNLTYRPSFGNSIGAENDDRKIIGQGQFPSLFGGLNTNFSYRGFSIDAFFNYSFGRVGSEFAHNAIMNPSDFQRNQLQELSELVWQAPGDIARFPQAKVGPYYWGGEWSSMNIQALDHIRLRTLTLSYEFPQTVLRNWKIQRLRIYATGTNLFTWTNYTGMDPEYTGWGNGFIFPNSRSYLGGIEISF